MRSRMGETLIEKLPLSIRNINSLTKEVINVWKNKASEFFFMYQFKYELNLETID